MVASTDEVLKFIEGSVLYGKGVGYVEVYLLGSVTLTAGTRLWTRDMKLRRIADLLGCARPESATEHSRFLPKMLHAPVACRLSPVATAKSSGCSGGQEHMIENTAITIACAEADDFGSAKALAPCATLAVA